MKTILYRYNPWWEGEVIMQTIIPRSKYLDQLEVQNQTKNIVMLTGLRRIGKTTLMKYFINKLIQTKQIVAKNILYVSLDDYLLEDFSILEILEEYRKIHHLSFKEKIYLFLDEVSSKKDFEVQLKNIYDNHNAKIFVSSSSASLLKKKKSYLTGRSHTIEVLPLDFEEYLDFKQIKITTQDTHLISSYFEEFMQTGGVPEYVLIGNSDYLRELVDDIIKKDIVVLHGIKNVQSLKDMFLLLMERSGKVVSLNKIANILGISVDTAKRYLGMFQETYLIETVARFGKTNERILAPKKIYATDLGIKSLFTGFRDKGSFFENYVYFLIKSKSPQYVFKNGIEVDFLTEDKTLIEVKYNAELNPKQKELFDSFVAKKKIVIHNIAELEKLK